MPDSPATEPAVTRARRSLDEVVALSGTPAETTDYSRNYTLASRLERNTPSKVTRHLKCGPRRARLNLVEHDVRVTSCGQSHEVGSCYICGVGGACPDMASSRVLDGVLPPIPLMLGLCAAGPQSMLAGAEAPYA